MHHTSEIKLLNWRQTFLLCYHLTIWELIPMEPIVGCLLVLISDMQKLLLHTSTKHFGHIHKCPIAYPTFSVLLKVSEFFRFGTAQKIEYRFENFL